jgi:hypothetical protein
MAHHVMSRAWVLFRERYGYRGRSQGIPFASIGRPCFNHCLRLAWREYREAAAIAAIPAEVKAERISTIRAHIAELHWMDNWRQAEADRTVYEAEIRRLAA